VKAQFVVPRWGDDEPMWTHVVFLEACYCPFAAGRKGQDADVQPHRPNFLGDCGCTSCAITT